jgi:hypothetical protein
MRVSGADAAGPAGAPVPGRAGDFRSVLREAEGRAAARTRAERREASARGQEDAAGRQARGRRATAAELRVGQAHRAVGADHDATAPLGAGTGPGGPGGPAAGGPASRVADPAGPPAGAVTLAAAVRAVVPAVEALRRSGREAVSLDFGRALGVELRVEPGGVAITLAAAPGLAAAARAELPTLARVLAARGVAVVRAEVRTRHAGRGRGR